jgi:CheY-like chemotaxis protein/HPt (histidine-containing phosphotransfer) domain-containing protein/anti-sigma regulatory factor (Ser/Thr protein kinase)
VDDLTPRTRGFLETAKASADALLNLLNDLLDFSRLETGQFSLRPQPFRMTDVCDGAVRTLSLRAQEKNLSLAWNVAPDVPVWLLGDAARLRQVIVNLVGNAIKFTERGNVRLAVELVESKDAIAHLRMTVADTGIGIAPNDQQRIFEAFTQVDASATRRYSGTGLGLSITRQLVLQMGGQIWVESEPNQGTTFTCFIPLPLCDRPEDDADKARRSPVRMRSARPLHVLVGEDTTANQLLVSAILERYGHTCEIAGDGVQLLSILGQRPFDAILLDVQMPRKDGLQTATEIRALDDPKLAAIPIVAMTAHALDSDRERCLAAGMTDYVSKPLSARKLIDILESVVGEPHGAAPPKTNHHAATPPLLSSPVGAPMDCFHYDESLKRLGDDRELFCSLAKCFVEDSDGLLDEVAAGNKAGEANRVERASHSLKGLAATFSAKAVVSRAQFIENCAREGDLSRVRALLPDLKTETEKLKVALGPYASEAQ